MNRRRCDLRFKQDPSVGSQEAINTENGFYRIGEDTIDKEIVHYLRRVASLIEGRHVSLDEILVMLNKILRQHSMVKREQIVYAHRYLNRKPP